jgi:hypothetical protein
MQEVKAEAEDGIHGKRVVGKDRWRAMGQRCA